MVKTVWRSKKRHSSVRNISRSLPTIVTFSWPIRKKHSKYERNARANEYAKRSRRYVRGRKNWRCGEALGSLVVMPATTTIAQYFDIVRSLTSHDNWLPQISACSSKISPSAHNSPTRNGASSTRRAFVHSSPCVQSSVVCRWRPRTHQIAISVLFQKISRKQWRAIWKKTSPVVN